MAQRPPLDLPLIWDRGSSSVTTHRLPAPRLPTAAAARAAQLPPSQYLYPCWHSHGSRNGRCPGPTSPGCTGLLVSKQGGGHAFRYDIYAREHLPEERHPHKPVNPPPCSPCLSSMHRFGPGWETAPPDDSRPQQMKVWFMGGPEVDAEIVRLFGGDCEALLAGTYDGWQQGPAAEALSGILIGRLVSWQWHRRLRMALHARRNAAASSPQRDGAASSAPFPHLTVHRAAPEHLAGDQLFRNAYRGTSKMYAADGNVLGWTKGLLVSEGWSVAAAVLPDPQ